MTASGQRDRDRSRHRGFPHAPFPIVMTSPFPARLRSSTREASSGKSTVVSVAPGSGRTSVLSVNSALRASRPTRLKGFRYSIDRGRCARFSGMARKGPFLPRQNTVRQRILFTGKGRQHAIDGKVLMLQTDSRQLLVGMGDLFQGRRLCAGNQNQSRECRIREGFHCVSVLVLLFLQPHQRAEVRRSIRMCIEVPAQAPGSSSIRMVCPVGAVSKTI